MPGLGLGRRLRNRFLYGESAGPSDVTIVGGNVPDSAPENRFVGTLSTVDPSDSSEHSYTLVDDDGGRFKLIGNELCTASVPIYRADGTTRSVTVRSTNNTAQTFDKILTINVAAPTVYNAISLNGSTDYYQDSAVIPFTGDSWGAFIFRSETGQAATQSGEQFIWSNGTTTAFSAVSVSILNGKLKLRMRDTTRSVQTNTVATTTVYNTGVDYCFIFQKITANVVLYCIPVETLTEVVEDTIVTGTANLQNFTSAAAGRSGARGGTAASFLRGNIRLAAFGSGVLSAQSRQRIAQGYHPATDLFLSCRMVHVFEDSALTTIPDGTDNAITAAKVGSGQTTTSVNLKQRVNSGISYNSLGYNQAFQTTTDGTFGGDSSDDDTGPVWFTGNYYGVPANTSIFMRFLNMLTNKEVAAWVDLGAGANGAWDKTYNGVPAGFWRPIFRYGNQRLIGAPILVGGIDIAIGQSNQERMNSQNAHNLTVPEDTSLVPQHAQNFIDPADFVTSFGGFAPAGPGDGVATALTLMRAATGRPRAYMSFARGGSSMGQWYPSGTSPFGTDYTNFKNAVNRLTRGLFSTIAITQGEANCTAGGPGDSTTNSGIAGVGSTTLPTTFAYYQAFLGALIDGIKTDFPKYPKSRPWFISNQLANTQVSVNQAAWSDVSSAQLQIALDRPTEAVFGGVRKFVPTDASELHLSTYRTPQELETQARLQAMGLATAGATGPVPTSFTRVATNQFRLLVTHSPGGSALSTLSGSNGNGWVQMSAVADFTTQISVSSTAIFDSDQIDVFTASDPGGTVYMRVLWGQNPATTDVPIDNFALPNVAGRSIVPTSTQAYLSVS